MDLEVLKKKISTFKGEGGRVKITDDSLLMEILSSWEQWTGPMKEFYRAIGVSQTGMASIIGRAKKLRREGYFPAEDFKEIKVEGSALNLTSLQSGPCLGVEMVWDNGKLIRFQQVEQLIDFLKKVA
ncbi:MAG: hypothetical protein ACXVB4_17895 [Pseudobdellovibrionaceae bacterium]